MRTQQTATPLLLLLVQIIGASTANESPLLQRFDSWAEAHKRTYSTAAEKAHRFNVWRENHSFIENHNVQGKSWTLGHNDYSDLTNAEFREYFNLDEKNAGRRPDMLHEPDTMEFEDTMITAPKVRRRAQNIPTHINWINEDVVTHVKNQGQCGSCWAFSAISVLESYHAINSGEKVSMSEQQLVECSLNDGGCNGGWPKNALNYVHENGGVCTDEEYPYLADDDGDCASMCNKVEGTDIPKPIYVRPRRHSAALQAAVSLNPVSVVMDSGTQDFQFYGEGIYDGDCTTNYNHAVTIVGYGEVDGKQFWIVRNSWGKSWGDDGYFHIVRDSTEVAVAGKCAILMFGTTIPPKMFS